MQTYNIFTNKPDSLLEGKADFLLASSVTLTQNLSSIPAIIMQAVHNLDEFSSVEILDLGLIESSDCIVEGANIDAKEVFAKGMAFGKSYELKGNYLILGESIPSSTTTPTATALALGYDVPNNMQTQSITTALTNVRKEMGSFEKLSLVSDNMLLFCAGFLLEASRRFHVVLAGGMQMAVCLLVADKLREDVLMQLQSDNITLATTAWIAQDENFNFKHILEQLSYTPHAIYTSFSFENAEIPVLKKYDEEEVKEDVGVGACLAYATVNKRENKEVLDAIELIIYMM